MERARDESGFVVVLAVAVLLIGILLSGAVITQVTSTEGTVRRDGSTKRALQAARAGLNEAKQLAIASAKTSWTDTTKACPKRNSDGTVGADALNYSASTSPTLWCPALSTDRKIGASGSFNYQISQPYTSGSGFARDIIATGTTTSGTPVTRRVRQTITSLTTIHNPFDDADVTGVAKVDVANNAKIGTANDVTVRSGGPITMATDSSAICGIAQPGAGLTTTLTPGSITPPCNGSVRAGSALGALKNITAPAVATTANGQTALTTYGSGWNAATKRLTVSADLTLTGNLYVFCELTINSNSTLTFNKSTTGPIWVYFDSPDNCGNPTVTTPFTLGSNAKIVTNSAYPVQAEIVGSATTATTVTISSNNTATFGEIYAPRSTFRVSSNNTYTGVAIANWVDLASNARILKGPQGPLPPGAGIESTTYTYGTFVECTSSGGTQNLTGC